MSTQQHLSLLIVLGLWIPAASGADAPYYALHFDGPGQFVELRETSRLASANREFTAEAWIRWTGDRKNQELFGTYVIGGDAPASGWDLMLWRGGDGPFVMALRSAGSESRGGGASFPIAGVATDVWHHVAAVVDRQRQLAVFVDGKRVRRDVWNAGVDAERSCLRLGAIPQQNTDGLRGLVRAFRLSSMARYDEAFDPPAGYRFEKDAGTVVLLDFSQPRPNAVQDVSGQGHHGMLVGARWARVDPERGVTLVEPRVAVKPSPPPAGETRPPVGRPIKKTDVPAPRPEVVKTPVEPPKVRVPEPAPPEPAYSVMPEKHEPKPEPKPQTPKPAERTPVPDEAAQAAARANVQAVLKEELAGATTATKKAALTKELRRLARDSGDDHANRYALLQEAVKAAVDAVRLDLALEIVDEVSEYFETDAWPLKTAALKDVLAKTRKSQDRDQAAEATLPLLDAAVAEDRFDAALALHQLAADALSRSTKTELRTAFRRRGEQIVAQQRRWNLAQLARDRLKTEPDNAKANLALGRFLCLDKAQWQEGLVFLSKGDDAALKAAAAADSRQPDRPADQVAVADLWWEAAQPAAGTEREQLLKRAQRWYRAGLADLSGLQKVRVEKRLQQIEAEIAVSTRPRSAPPSPFK